VQVLPHVSAKCIEGDDEAGRRRHIEVGYG